MARIFIEGFELGNMYNFEQSNGAISITTSSPIDGSYSFYPNGGGVGLGKSITASSIVYIAGTFRLNTGNPYICVIRNNSSVISSLRISTVSRCLQYYRGSTSIATSASALSSDVNYRLEWHLTLSSSTTGRAIIKVNNESVLNYEDITQPGADTQFNQIWFGSTGAMGVGFTRGDNFVIDSTGWIGNTRISVLSPNSSGASTGWTPSAGENYACVNPVPMTTAAYVGTNTASALDLYGLPSIVSSATAIKCVQVSVLHEVEGAPTPTKTQIAISHNSTQAFSSSLTPGAAGSPVYASKLWETNPVTGSAWEISDVNDLQIGIKSATA